MNVIYVSLILLLFDEKKKINLNKQIKKILA